MFFEKITLNNFATYQGSHTIKLAPTSPNKPIVLIGGKNGCGKTTLLDSLQLALFGPLARCSNRGKLTYLDFLERSINRNTSLDEGAGLELTFSCHIEGDEHRFKISRTWNKKGKTVKERFFVFKLIGDEIKFDRVLSDNWNDYLEGLFPSNIAHLFFFDGEKIEQLADFENSAQLLQSAIYSLLGLNAVDQLSQDLTTLEGKKHKALKGLSDDKEIQGIKEDLKRTNLHLDQLTQEKASHQNLLDSLEKEMKEIEARYWQHGGELFDRRQELEHNLERAQKASAESDEQLRAIAAGVAPLLLVTDLLTSINQQAELEAEAGRQTILHESLTSRDKDLLGLIENLQLPSDALKTIDTFLQEDRNTREKATNVECYLNLSENSKDSLKELINKELPEVKKLINTDLHEATDAKARLEAVERALAGVPEEDSIADLVQERKNKREQINQAKRESELLQLGVEKSRREREQKESELRKTLQLSAQKHQQHKDVYRLVDHSGRVRETLHAFRTKVIKKHITQIEQLVLDSFKSILRKKSLISDLRINPDNFQVELFGPDNNLISTERLSAGERQLLATSLLWGICRAAGMPLPTVIDTPLGRLDSTHRAKLIQNYFPQASHQVLLLSTDEEITGKYYKDLAPYISHTYLLNHDDKNGGTLVANAYFG